MPRLRTFVAFLGGLLFALVIGLVPSEAISTLREWAGRPGPDPDADPDSEATQSKRHRARIKGRRRSS